MKIAVRYVRDRSGKTKAVQLPLTEWEKVLTKLKKYEQTLKIKSDLRQAFKEVAQARKSKLKKQSLTDFLNEL